MSGQNTRPRKKTKENRKYIMRKEGRQRTSLEKRDQKVTEKKFDRNRTN